jgi:hypothetical protein
MRIPPTGGIQSVNCVSVGNATPSTSGAGITFPATQSASTNANTLDDYEEGSCTITLSDSAGNNATMTGDNAWRYIKIGRSVTVSGTLGWSSTSSLAGASRIRLTGLPFQAENIANMRWAGTTGSSASGSFNIVTSAIKFGVDANLTFMWGTNVTGNNVDNSMFKADMGTSGTLFGLTVTYFSAS